MFQNIQDRDYTFKRDQILFKEEAQKYNDELLRITDDAKEKMNRITQMLTAVTTATQEFGVVKYGKRFADESDGYKKESKDWRTAIIWLLIGTVASALVMFFCMKMGVDNTHEVILLISTRIIIISCLFVALSFCIKGYKASRHNAIVNTHRQNALTTFETFVKSTEDQETKEYILKSVTKTIFSNQNTGYDSGDKDGDSTTNIVEIIKNISQSKES